jgi:channel protein (hemolysin III family)
MEGFLTEGYPAAAFTLLQVIPYWGIREPVSMVTHLAGAIGAVLATIVLVRRARRAGRRGRAVVVYGVSVALALGASAAFHYVGSEYAQFSLLNKSDHAAIFLVVAGTGTVIYNALAERGAELLIAATWGVNLTAMTVKLVFWPLAPWLTAALYVSVAWISSTGLHVIQRPRGAPLRHFIAGMVVLTVAAFVFVLEWPSMWPGVVESHELFHVLVLFGLGLHGRFVYLHCSEVPAR